MNELQKRFFEYLAAVQVAAIPALLFYLCFIFLPCGQEASLIFSSVTFSPATYCSAIPTDRFAAPHRHITRMGFHFLVRSSRKARRNSAALITSKFPTDTAWPLNTAVFSMERPAAAIRATTAGRREAIMELTKEPPLYL